MIKNIQFLLISSVLFSYQILVSTYLSSSLAGQSISLLIAPTYLAFALALLVSFIFDRLKSDLTDGLSSSVLAGLILSLFLINTAIQNMNADILNLGQERRAELRYLESYIPVFYNKYLFFISLSMSLPFFIYGLYFSSLLRFKKQPEVLRLISYELIGANLGILLSLIFLNYFGWILTFLLFFTLASVTSMIFFVRKKKFVFSLLTLALLFLSFLFIDQIKPVSNLHISGRDFGGRQNITLINESWNSFSKVQTLSFNLADGRKVISMGDGTGHARVPSFKSPERSITTEVTNYFKPQKVLILFAGAGYELIKFSEQNFPPAEVTGVEINSHVIEHGFLASNGALQKILENPSYKLVQSDARQFLEKDTSHYDAILFSWSGATVAYYSGAIMHTTQYVFTREALQAALEKLNPGGRLIIFGGSKLNLINHLRALKIEDLKDKITLLEPRSDANWKRNWDNHILVIAKNSENPAPDLSGLTELAKSFGYSPIIHPSLLTDKSYQPIEDLMTHPDWPATLAAFNQSSSITFASHTDDNPFIYQTSANLSFSQIKKNLSQMSSFHFNYSVIDLIIYIIILSIALLLSKSNRAHAPSLILSFFFGLISTSLQFFAIYKSILFLGFPNFALGLGLIVSLGSSFVCFIVVRQFKITKKQFLCLQFLGLLFLTGLIFLFQISELKSFIFSLPLFVQIFLLLFLFLVTFILNGFFYPYLISLHANHLSLSKQIIVFDVLGCGLGSLLIPLLIEDHGISTILLASATLSAMLLLSFFVSFKKSVIGLNS